MLNFYNMFSALYNLRHCIYLCHQSDHQLWNDPDFFLHFPGFNRLVTQVKNGRKKSALSFLALLILLEFCCQNLFHIVNNCCSPALTQSYMWVVTICIITSCTFELCPSWISGVSRQDRCSGFPSVKPLFAAEGTDPSCEPEPWSGTHRHPERSHRNQRGFTGGRRCDSAAFNWQTHVLQVAPESGRLVWDRLLERKQQEFFPLRVRRGVNLLDFHQYSAAGLVTYGIAFECACVFLWSCECRAVSIWYWYRTLYNSKKRKSHYIRLLLKSLINTLKKQSILPQHCRPLWIVVHTSIQQVLHHKSHITLFE